MEIFGGLILGFFGSLHCIGMCGPIVLALPVRKGGSFVFILRRVIYNLGRVATYGLFGLIFGILGNRIALSGFQQVLTISAGILLLLYFVIPLQVKSRFLINPVLNKPITYLKKLLSRLLQNTTIGGFFLIGLLNGFLPCGFVYIGIAGALVLSDPLLSMMFMIMFGFGTIPALLGTAIAGKFVSLGFRKKFSKLIPVFSVLIALMFILRGLNLGIPYISPKLPAFSSPSNQHINCH
jgi:hypothetical protein